MNPETVVPTLIGLAFGIAGGLYFTAKLAVLLFGKRRGTKERETK